MLCQTENLHSLPAVDKLTAPNTRQLFMEPDVNGRSIYLHRLDGVRLCGSSLHYPNVLAYSAYDDRRYQPMCEKIMSLAGLAKPVCEPEPVPPVIRRCDTPLFYFIYNTDNYYHFIYDSLPYLISFQHLRRQMPGLKLLMNFPTSQASKFYPFVSEFLALMDLGKNDIVIAEEGTQYNQLYLSDSYTHGHDSQLPPRTEIYDMFRSLVDAARPNFNGETPEKLYISRRTWLHNNFSNIGTNYTTRRKLENENALVELLEAQGYAEVFTENLSTIDKLKYFAQAKHVVGAIGGGVCNVLFSPPVTRLVCLISPTFLDVNRRFLYSFEHVALTLFEASNHTEPGRLKRYMRVNCPEQGLVGEISAINGDRIEVSYTREKVAGWNSQNVYDTIMLDQAQCIPLDAGLNSPWSIDLKAFARSIL